MITNRKRISMLEHMMEEQKNRQQYLNERLIKLEKRFKSLDQEAYKIALRVAELEKTIEDMK